MIHTLFLVLHATTLMTFLGVFSPSSCVLALPLRTPSVAWIDPKGSPLHVTLPRTSRRTTKIKLKQDPTRAFSRSPTPRVVTSRTVTAGNLTTTREDTDPFPQLNKYYQAAEKSSRKIRTYIASVPLRSHSPSLQDELATQSAGIHESDPLFQQESTAQLTSFKSDLLGIQEILKPLGADKGLAFYDPTNKLEGLLKNIVNFSKDTLEDIDTLVSQVPILGPSECAIFRESFPSEVRSSCLRDKMRPRLGA